MQQIRPSSRLQSYNAVQNPAGFEIDNEVVEFSNTLVIRGKDALA